MYTMKNKVFINLSITVLIILVDISPLNASTELKDFNVLLITADALRADHLSCYGYKRNTTPFLNNFIKDAIIFTQAISHASHTPISMGSIATGTYFAKHYLREWGDTLNPSLPTLAEILKKNGYKTIFICGAELFNNLFGFNRGFDVFLIENTSLNFSKGVFEQLIKFKDSKFFLWVHYMGTHRPYFASQNYLDIFLKDEFYNANRKLRIVKNGPHDYGFRGIPKNIVIKGIDNPDFYIAQYDASIRLFDEQLNLLFEILKELNLFEKTIIIITADHGELLGEHRYYFHHGYFLYEPLIKVPLIIKFNNFLKESVIDQQVEASVDIMPTIIQLLGIKTKLKFGGRSLLPLILNRGGDL